MTYLADICEMFFLVWGELKQTSKIEEMDKGEGVTLTPADESLGFKTTPK